MNKFLLPSLEEQEKIATILGKIQLKIEKEQEKLNSLNEYKKRVITTNVFVITIN
ncbi:hypothetical protein [Terrisporobacter sp.]